MLYIAGKSVAIVPVKIIKENCFKSFSNDRILPTSMKQNRFFYYEELMFLYDPIFCNGYVFVFQ